MSDQTLLVKEICKAFRTPTGSILEVLRGVSFSVAAGEMVAIVGASGTGKSTLLHILGALEAADSGSARLDGFDVAQRVGAELGRFRNRDVGFVFQFHRLLPDLTAVENVALPLLIARRSWRQAHAAAMNLLDRVGLTERAAHKSGELSGGEQQRVAIARALVTSPRLVLADEPTGNLDTRTGEEVGALLLSLCRARNAAVIVATHNERLARTCDRILLLHNGKVQEAVTGVENKTS